MKFLNLIFLKFFYNPFYKFYIYIYKMYKSLPAKYYSTKKRKTTKIDQNLSKEDIEIFLKKKMKERDNIIVNVNKNLSENENYKLVEYSKKNNTTRKKQILI